jgi:hypothetical protein
MAPDTGANGAGWMSVPPHDLAALLSPWFKRLQFLSLQMSCK